MECLPNLTSLDTEYLGSGNYRVPTTPLPALQQLTVRTGSVDIHGPDRLWTWTRTLLPHLRSLKSFTLNSFSVFGRMAIPWPFIIFLTTKQAESLEEFIIMGAAMLNLDSLSQLCLKCPALKTVDCTVASPDVVSHSPHIARGMKQTTHRNQLPKLQAVGTRSAYSAFRSCGLRMVWLDPWQPTSALTSQRIRTSLQTAHVTKTIHILPRKKEKCTLK